MVIGIDGGGTKTEAVLVDRASGVVLRLLDVGSNPNVSGFEAAARTLGGMIDRCRAVGEIEAICLSLAGAGTPDIEARMAQAMRAQAPPACRVRVGSDALGCMSSGIKRADGVVVIAGTGSAAFARRDGAYFRVGGWGHLIDDAGSGYDIGRLGLRAVLRAHDGRAPETAMTQRFIDHLGGARPWEALALIYEGGKQRVAGFAPVVLGTERDAQAQAIVDRACAELAQMARTAGAHIQSARQGIPVVAAGSIWKSDRIFIGVRRELGAGYRLLRPQRRPVFGAAVEAAADAGWPTGDAFDAAFDRTYAEAAADA